MAREGIVELKAEMVKCKARHNGDPMFQAEILLTLPTGRTMTIRGPTRPDADQAQRDTDELEGAGKDGVKGVRDLAMKLKKGRVRTTEM